MRTTVLSLALCAMASLVATAANVWETKPFMEWSEKDVEKVMTDSPWAGKASLTHARAGANLGQVPDWKLTVSVCSAVPYRQAQLRRQTIRGTAVTPQLEAAITADEPLYVIAISGIPRIFQAQAAAIATATAMRRPHKAALKPTEARVLLFDKDGKEVTAPQGSVPGAPPEAAGGGRQGGFGGGFAEDKSGITATIFLGFPKSDAISVDDGEVEISTTIAAYEMRKTFKLKDMLFKGKLAL